MAAAIALMVISLGAIVAGRGYVKTARRMRSFATTRGRVLERGIEAVPGGSREGRWGKGGGFQPKITYTYAVGGVDYTSSRSSYAYRGLKKSLAEQEAAAVPDEVEVHYDPAAPKEAYLHTHTPGIGKGLIAGGIVGVLLAVLILIPG